MLGEDLAPRAGGVARDMSDPTAYGQPDHTASNLYDFAPDYDDNGGVHTNSGVPNKTAYLVVDGTAGEPGGAFNGAAFPGIGPDKAARPLLDRAAVADPGGRLRRPRRRPPAVLHQPRGDRRRGHRRRRLRIGAGRGHGHRPHPLGRAVRAARGVDDAGRPVGAADLGRPPRPPGRRRSPPTPCTSTRRCRVRTSRRSSRRPGRSTCRGWRPGTTYTVGLVAVTADGTSPAVLRTFGGTSLRVRWPESVVYGTTLRLRGALVGAGGSPAGRAHRAAAPAPAGSSGRWETVVKDRTGSAGGFTLPSRPGGRRPTRSCSPAAAP